MTIPQYVSDMIEGFQNKDARYVDLGNHMGKSEENFLTEIPYEDLGKLETIKTFSIKNNEITKIDARIGAMTNLDVLDLSENPLTEIAPEIGNCINLKMFKAAEIAEVDLEEKVTLMMSEVPGYRPHFLSDAGLKTLPPTFGQLKQLTSLYLEDNRFEKIPDAIFELENLSFLELSLNQLTHISPKIGQLKNLTYLKLSYNNFHELPDEIGDLKKLARLRLDGLDLYSLEGIGRLTNLEMLEICYGQIGELPNSIKHLKKLKNLYLYESKISDIDLNMVRVLLPDCEVHLEF